MRDVSVPDILIFIMYAASEIWPSVVMHYMSFLHYMYIQQIVDVTLILLIL